MPVRNLTFHEALELASTALRLTGTGVCTCLVLWYQPALLPITVMCHAVAVHVSSRLP